MSKTKICSIFIFLIFLGFCIYGLRQHRLMGNTSNQSATVSLSDQFADQSTDGVLYPVSRVIDGDTIVVNVAGVDEKVRLIGVNTPETVDPRKPVQCFGVEASDFVKHMLTGKSVRLESDPTQSDRDKYGRLLRYVYLDDVLVDEKIIEEGYGFEYTYTNDNNSPYQFQKEFKASEKYARAGEIGLWATSTCNGKLTPLQ